MMTQVMVSDVSEGKIPGVAVSIVTLILTCKKNHCVGRWIRVVAELKLDDSHFVMRVRYFAQNTHSLGDSHCAVQTKSPRCLGASVRIAQIETAHTNC